MPARVSLRVPLLVPDQSQRLADVVLLDLVRTGRQRMAEVGGGVAVCLQYRPHLRERPVVRHVGKRLRHRDGQQVAVHLEPVISRPVVVRAPVAVSVQEELVAIGRAVGIPPHVHRSLDAVRDVVRGDRRPVLEPRAVPDGEGPLRVVGVRPPEVSGQVRDQHHAVRLRIPHVLRQRAKQQSRDDRVGSGVVQAARVEGRKVEAGGRHLAASRRAGHRRRRGLPLGILTGAFDAADGRRVRVVRRMMASRAGRQRDGNRHRHRGSEDPRSWLHRKHLSSVWCSSSRMLALDVDGHCHPPRMGHVTAAARRCP